MRDLNPSSVRISHNHKNRFAEPNRLPLAPSDRARPRENSLAAARCKLSRRSHRHCGQRRILCHALTSMPRHVAAKPASASPATAPFPPGAGEMLNSCPATRITRNSLRFLVHYLFDAYPQNPSFSPDQLLLLLRKGHAPPILVAVTSGLQFFT